MGVPWHPLPLLFLSFFGEKPRNFYETPPQGGGQLGPHPTPCHTPVPVGIKKKKTPKVGIPGSCFLGA